VDEIEAAGRGADEGEDHRPLHRAGGDQACGDGARGADPIGTIGAALGIEDIVREVGPDLDRERTRERGERGWPRDAARGGSDGGADRDRHHGCGQGARACRRDPGRERHGVTRIRGTAGTW
jgi:hypothetical protein